jgi:hypothetical protein
MSGRKGVEGGSARKEKKRERSGRNRIGAEEGCEGRRGNRRSVRRRS